MGSEAHFVPPLLEQERMGKAAAQMRTCGGRLEEKMLRGGSSYLPMIALLPGQQMYLKMRLFT